MNRSILLGAIAAVSVFSVAAANAQSAAPAPSATVEAPSQEPQDRQDALSAGLRNDWTTQTALAARAFREDPSLVNQFNLATGYENTGRSALAIPLYQDIASRGQYVSIKAAYDPRNESRRGRLLLPNLAAEASRRLDAIAGRPAPLE